MIARRIVPSSLKISHVRNRVEPFQSRRSTTASISDSYQRKPPASGWKDTMFSSSYSMTPAAYFLPFDEEEESKQNAKQETVLDRVTRIDVRRIPPILSDSFDYL
eukprot:scaffold3747_cov99-Cylindrotheca_fusiformis.AAC.1